MANPYSRLDADAGSRRLADEVIPVRLVLHDLHWHVGFKSLVMFGLFYVVYVTLSTLRMDWWSGHTTLSWLNEASSGVPSLTDASTIREIASFLDGDLTKVVGALKERCPQCDVGITSLSTDLTFLGLTEFVCSDFDSTAGSSLYPPRDCVAVDAAWASHPSSTSAPCCTNATLVRASVAMMTEALAYGITEMSLSKLLSGGSDPSYSSTEYFADANVRDKHFVLQLIVSRSMHMAAIEYHAQYIDPKNAPGVLEASTTFWSFDFSNQPLQAFLLLLMFLAGLGTLLHDHADELSGMFYDAPPSPAALAAAATRRYSPTKQILASKGGGGEGSRRRA